MMNGENASEKIDSAIAFRFSEHGKVADDENQQSSVAQELGTLFPSIRGGGRRGESSEFLTVGAGESSASTTHTNNINFATHSQPQNGRLKKYGDQKQHERNH